MSTAEVKERPIIFSDEMVRAILDGRKTQARVVIEPQLPEIADTLRDIPGENRWWCAIKVGFECGFFFENPGSDYQHDWKCPYGTFGDRLWVRENFYIDSFGAGVAQISYAADGERGRACGVSDRKLPNRCGSVPSKNMPRHCSRINLEITDVRIERVQDIREEDAIAEGVNGGCLECGHPDPCGCTNPSPDHRDGFIWLWDHINEKRGFGWESNPWVWVVEFEVV